MPCRRLTIEEYEGLTPAERESGFANQNLCQQSGCCAQDQLRMLDYRLFGSDTGSPWTLTEGLCCGTLFGEGECRRMGFGDNGQYGRVIQIYDFRCESGVLKCTWTLGCFTGEKQLTNNSGTAEIQFSGDAPSGLTNVVITSQSTEPELVDCPISDPSKCDSTDISQLSIVPT